MNVHGYVVVPVVSTTGSIYGVGFMLLIYRGGFLRTQGDKMNSR